MGVRAGLDSSLDCHTFVVCHREWIFKVSLNTTNLNLAADSPKSLENIRFSFQASLLPRVDHHSFPVPPKGRLPPPLLPWIKSSCDKSHKDLAQQRDVPPALTLAPPASAAAHRGLSSVFQAPLLCDPGFQATEGHTKRKMRQKAE